MDAIIEQMLTHVSLTNLMTRAGKISTGYCVVVHVLEMIWQWSFHSIQQWRGDHASHLPSLNLEELKKNYTPPPPPFTKM
jgi:hypothetical protein